ncbi:MAG: type I methionyl aminopeptidase [Elusimicrobia bacterium]|nr:type I methionyl aminopeptidase [Elusimicrobiota bacterium]
MRGAAAAAIELKSRSEIEAIRRSGRAVARVLAKVSKAVRPGMKTWELETLAREESSRLGVKPAFLGYLGYSAALCVSINQEVVHGIPSPRRVVKEGDVVSLDYGCVLEGFFADAAVTVGVGRIGAEAQRLIDVTRVSLEKAVAAMKADGRLGDVSSAVQRYVEGNGFSVVRDFSGHGIGRALHESPSVPNFGGAGTGMRLQPGLVLAIEPMVTAGSEKTEVLADGWTAVTKDGSLAAHFEHTVALSERGPEVLTEDHG